VSEGRRVAPFEIAGPAGRLSGVVHVPATPVRALSVVSHPHPLFGGTMDNKVAYRTTRALESCGAIVGRFDFRGVRRSEGVHDRGIGEQDDLRAVLAHVRAVALEARAPASLPVILAGFSFGSVVSSRVACAGEPGVVALLLVGAPVLSHRFGELLTRPRELRVACVQGARDEHGPLPALETAWAAVPEPKRLIVVPSAGHFFDDEQQELFDAARELIDGFLLA
jgi:alpha/beta superfamily hydrolase